MPIHYNEEYLSDPQYFDQSCLMMRFFDKVLQLYWFFQEENESTKCQDDIAFWFLRKPIHYHKEYSFDSNNLFKVKNSNSHGYEMVRFLKNFSIGFYRKKMSQYGTKMTLYLIFCTCLFITPRNNL